MGEIELPPCHPNEELARMTNVRYGVCDDRLGYPCLAFEVEMLSGAAMLVLGEAESRAIIMQTNVDDVTKLNGSLCAVYQDGGYVRFLRMWR